MLSPLGQSKNDARRVSVKPTRLRKCPRGMPEIPPYRSFPLKNSAAMEK